MSPQLSLRQVKTAFLDLLLPLRCLSCGREGYLIRPSCRLSLPRIKFPLCQRCGATVSEGNLCHSCLNYPLAIDGIRSAFLFQGIVRQAVLQFKYRHLKALAVQLSELIAEFLSSYPLKGEVLIPVPLYPKRLRQRGYNEATLLATELGKLISLPVEDNILVRVKDAMPQARTRSAAERRLNVYDAFACHQSLEGKQILLIDDVCTTGSTLDACARALKAAGSGSVWGLTVAREMFSSSSK